MLRDLCICAALVVGTLGIYGQTLGFDFVAWDDPFHVVENEEVNRGLTSAGIAWAFSTSEVPNWHPLTWISHMLDCELFGLDAGGHHATNVALHALNSLLVFGLFAHMTGARWRSAVVAALFAVHPLHVESVAWVSERKDLLSALFALLSTWAYVVYARRGGAPAYVAALALLALALMSKAMPVTLPFVFLLLDYWPLRRGLSARLLLEKLPFFALVACASAITIALQGSSGAVKTAELVSLEARLANALSAYALYLGKLLWPTDLTMFYPHPAIPEAGGIPRAAWQATAAAALLAVISAWAARARDRRWAPVGWLWYLGTLLPVIGLVQVGQQALADRYTYLPSLGLFVIAAWGGAELVDRFRPRLRRVEALTAVAIAGVLLALGVAASVQAAHWRDSRSLFRHALEVVPRNPVVRYELAQVLREQGLVDEAVAQYRGALEVTPRLARLHVGLGNALRDRGELEQAIRHYRLALETHPEHFLAHSNLGAVYGKQGQMQEAVAHYRAALRARPDNATLRYNLANALRRQGKLDEAIASYLEALEREPDDARIHNNLGGAYFAREDYGEAARHFRRAVQLRPSHARAHANLGLALYEQGRLDEALAEYRAALEIEPDYAAAHGNLARALRAKGSLDEARRHYRRALELDPADTEARGALRELTAAGLSPEGV
jgi:tetratricopeptide (TPR) repeat protein